MPNWCSNSLTITHEDSAKIDALEAELKKGDDAQVFNHIVPRPLEEEENWYSWNVNNWGTKWDVTPYSWERDGNRISMNFDTAWSPPTTLYETMEDDGWQVRAFYHEPGMVFIGIYEDGYDDYYEYDITDRESIENLPEELIEYGNLMEEHENWVEENKDETEMD